MRASGNLTPFDCSLGGCYCLGCQPDGGIQPSFDASFDHAEWIYDPLRYNRCECTGPLEPYLPASPRDLPCICRVGVSDSRLCGSTANQHARAMRLPRPMEGWVVAPSMTSTSAPLCPDPTGEPSPMLRSRRETRQPPSSRWTTTSLSSLPRPPGSPSTPRDGRP